jgi:ferric-dicitrate binding protein FerR (iron transport regulator)
MLPGCVIPPYCIYVKVSQAYYSCAGGGVQVALEPGGVQVALEPGGVQVAPEPKEQTICSLQVHLLLGL